jgi:hypothetical protein
MLIVLCKHQNRRQSTWSRTGHQSETGRTAQLKEKTVMGRVFGVGETRLQSLALGKVGRRPKTPVGFGRVSPEQEEDGTWKTETLEQDREMTENPEHCWKTGMLENWNAGKLECWKTGMPEDSTPEDWKKLG